MPEIEASEKRQGLHLACFRSTSIESKENFLARTPKMPAKCESQASASGAALYQLRKPGDSEYSQSDRTDPTVVTIDCHGKSIPLHQLAGFSKLA